MPGSLALYALYALYPMTLWPYYGTFVPLPDQEELLPLPAPAISIEPYGHSVTPHPVIWVPIVGADDFVVISVAWEGRQCVFYCNSGPKRADKTSPNMR
jgi:hypothetical protein